nr:2A [Feline sakobuvirus A]
GSCFIKPGVVHQISLVQHGVKARVSLEEPVGEIYREVPYYCFEMIARTLGSVVPYNYRDNCGEYITRFTGVSLPNTGLSLAAGLTVAAGALCLAQTALEVKRQ